MNPSPARTARIARGFDRLAPFYDALAEVAFAGRLHASQVALLGSLPPVRRALVMGGGTGRFLAAFLAHDSLATAVSIDLSPGMTRRTEKRLAGAGVSSRAELRVGSLDRLHAGERFDLVVTHCFLDLFVEPTLGAVIDRLDRSLEPGGHWLFSDFQSVGMGGPAFIRRSVVSVLYAFFRTSCSIDSGHLEDFHGGLTRIGLIPIVERVFFGRLLIACLLRKPGGNTPIGLVRGPGLDKTQVSFL